MDTLNLIVILFVTVLFGGLGIYSFYHAFKRYKDNQDFFDELPADFFIFSLIADLILWVSKKWSPKLIMPIYRVLTFVFGLIMMTLFILFMIVLLH